MWITERPIDVSGDRFKASQVLQRKGCLPPIVQFNGVIGFPFHFVSRDGMT